MNQHGKRLTAPIGMRTKAEVQPTELAHIAATPTFGSTRMQAGDDYAPRKWSNTLTAASLSASPVPDRRELPDGAHRHSRVDVDAQDPRDALPRRLRLVTVDPDRRYCAMVKRSRLYVEF